MRQIKFRFYGPNEKDWIEPKLIELDENGEFFHLYGTDFITSQFTGIFDKNDKEVYEGDIVRKEVFDGEFKIGDVKWYSQEDDYDYDGWSCERFALYNFEVVGNIYENPELLSK